MSLISEFGEHVPAEIKARGADYFQRGAVRNLRVDVDYVTAQVQGNELYEVELWLEDGQIIDGECDCPYFLDHGEPCKHIWATVLAASGRFHHMEPAIRRKRGKRVDHVPKPPMWKRQLATLRNYAADRGPYDADRVARKQTERQVLYALDVPQTLNSGELIVRIMLQERKANGQWGKPKSRRMDSAGVMDLSDPADRQIVAALRGSSTGYGGYYGYMGDSARLHYDMAALLLPQMCATGRVRLWDYDEYHSQYLPEDAGTPVSWDDGPPWDYQLKVERDERDERYLISGVLRRGEEEVPLSKPALVLAGGLVFMDDRAARMDDHGAFAWISLLRQHPQIAVPFAQADEWLEEMFGLPGLPPMELPQDLQVEQTTEQAKPRLRIYAADAKKGYVSYVDKLRASLSFDYGGRVVEYGDQRASCLFQRENRRLIRRDLDAELKANHRLLELGMRYHNDFYEQKHHYLMPKSALGKVVRILSAEGWHVEAEGKLYRRPGNFNIQVTSGIDWFDLNVEVDFDGKKAKLPSLLAALKKGENTIQLDDGTLGMLPEEWLKKYGFIAGMGKAEDGKIRFGKTQAGLLDAMLASQPEATWDETFGRTLQELRRFEGVQAVDPPPTFQGELRPYQREGLGWFGFLDRFGFGGCLADDMGLGKTVQVLALLEGRRQQHELPAGEDAKRKTQNANALPSLVVVPKSLVFNWKLEAQRFTPNLRVLEHTGIGRVREAGHLGDYDLIITTYGTLRRDAAFLKDVRFDYVILDEAQAVKNPSSESAKAVRLVQGNHRLALSGTPVQNHLGDLWSLFDFLNPGMLGGVSVFAGTGSLMRNPDEDTRKVLSRALRPFILRRTKEQVASDLPPRLEQTIWCELDPAQRQLYDELKEHYRQALLKQVDAIGINRSKIQILEALLRLRQAALHPGLIDPAKTKESSAKLDVLLPQLDEVLDEGHKALLFSQFTSMLSIVRKRLDKEKVVYEYLDGQTRDRQARVERFQTDPKCKLFLISLKAGGLGLNLTAADYVFLLDPWWNPAVEQQAIDRTHRIGQTRQVYACRLIAKDTVEEKVLALQQTKKALADAIISADNSLIRTLGREDLELLLS